MNLDEFNLGTPDTKPWLNPVVNILTANNLVADVLDVLSLESKAVTLINQASVPNPAVGKVTVFTDLSGNLGSQDPLGNITAYVSADAPASSTAGNVPMYADATGLEIVDSGVVAADIPQNQLNNNAVLDQAYPLAPAGLRDLWQYTPGTATGTMIRYWPGPDIFHSSGDNTGQATYSTDGGVTWNACVFDVVTIGFITIGYNGTVWVAIGSGTTDAYTSPDGINFTQQAALPSSGSEGFNIEWFALGGVFIHGVSDAGHRILTSPDGVTWTLRVSVPQALTIGVNSVIAVAVGQTGAFYQWSADGITWHDTVSAVESSRAVAWSDDKKQWLAIGYATGNVYTSSDGKVWALAASASAPVNVNAVMWNGNNDYNRWYATFRDADDNYSLWSTIDASFPFVGSHLDGALKQHLSYSLGYDASRDRFFIGVNAAPYFAYGTARPTTIKSLADSILVRGHPAGVGVYSTYSDSTVNNTGTETNISTGAASFIGSLALQADQPLGMVIHMKVCFTVSSAAGDALDIRYKSNGTLLFTHNLTIPALAVDLPVQICTDITIRNGNIYVCSVANQNGTLNMLINSAIIFDRTILNTLSVTAQWGGALSTLTAGHVGVMCDFVNGA